MKKFGCVLAFVGLCFAGSASATTEKEVEVKKPSFFELVTSAVLKPKNPPKI